MGTRFECERVKYNPSDFELDIRNSSYSIKFRHIKCSPAHAFNVDQGIEFLHFSQLRIVFVWMLCLGITCCGGGDHFIQPILREK